MENALNPLFDLTIPDVRTHFSDTMSDAVIAMTCQWAARHWRRTTTRQRMHLLEAAALYSNVTLVRWLRSYYRTWHETDLLTVWQDRVPDLIVRASIRALHSGCFKAWRLLYILGWEERFDDECFRALLLSRPLDIRDWNMEHYPHRLMHYAFERRHIDMALHVITWRLHDGNRDYSRIVNGPWHSIIHNTMFYWTWYRR